MVQVVGNVDVPIWLLLILGIVMLYYIYYSQNARVFDGCKLPGLPPYLSPFGLLLFKFTKMSLVDADTIIMKLGKTVVLFNGPIPAIMTMDEEIIKAVFIKEFTHFTDKLPVDVGDSVSNDLLSMASGSQWKKIRKITSPAFSSGKFKNMMGYIDQCSQAMLNKLKQCDGKPCNIRLVMEAYAMDVVAGGLFGLKLNCQNDPTFVRMAARTFNISITNPLILICVTFPFLVPLIKALRVRFIPKDVVDFFEEITKQILAERRDEKMERNDLFQLLLNANKDAGKKNTDYQPSSYGFSGHVDGDQEQKVLSYAEMVSQVILFFSAGLGTPSVAATFILYNLAWHPEIQEKLFKEVRKCMHGKETLDHGTLQQMKYLEQCIYESLRLYPNGIRVHRRALCDVTIQGIPLKKGSDVIVPVYPLHHNPDLWENPEEFIPERFENMSGSSPKFLPFGLGPRNCIGMRLAMIELKVAVASIINCFIITPHEKTKLRMRFGKTVLLTPEKPIKLCFQLRP